jgi:hypothetical protein
MVWFASAEYASIAADELTDREAVEYRLRMELMTVQIDHGRIDIERIRQQIELDSKRHDAEMKRLDEEIARAKQLYNVEIWN